MKFDYGTLLSFEPISLSIGTLRKPTLREISSLTFEKFNFFEAFLKITPEIYCTKMCTSEIKSRWESLSESKKDSATIYSILLTDEKLQSIYLEIFNYFFVEPVVFREEMFILLNRSIDDVLEIEPNDVRGVIHEETFTQILELIQQICCIYEEEEDISSMKFKNKTAKKLYEKMLKAQKQQRKNKKNSLDMTIPNLISSVASMHPSINLINIWDLTIFQLLDTFSRLQTNLIYDIEARKVSVWGDEKKTFDIALWYKNEYDKK